MSAARNESSSGCIFSVIAGLGCRLGSMSTPFFYIFKKQLGCHEEELLNWFSSEIARYEDGTLTEDEFFRQGFDEVNLQGPRPTRERVLAVGLCAPTFNEAFVFYLRIHCGNHLIRFSLLPLLEGL